jgi:DNA-binding response OmpR family regulator
MNHRNRKKILLADDIREYRRSVLGFLELEDYLVIEAETPEEAQKMLETEELDLALVDIRMRDNKDTLDMSGLAIAKFASERNIPCIIVTAFPTVELARAALRSVDAEPYAQDIITKGSDPQAVLASINSTLKRRDSKPSKLAADGISVDLDKKLVRKNGIPLKLSKNQYSLMEELYKKNGGVCSYKELIKAIYNEDLTATEAQNDKRLRHLVERTTEKIEDKDSDHEYIEAVPGRGFLLNLQS